MMLWSNKARAMLCSPPDEPCRSEDSSSLLLPFASAMAWLSPTYLAPHTLAAVSKHFCKNSSIELQDFLRDDV
jgi:hypothetical protein